jgi:isoquinoline 1-oxidoreductase alpha subunit
MQTLKINGKKYQIDVEAEMPLLWVLRDDLGLTGTKFGCGIGECGACTVHINGQAVRSCSFPVAAAVGTKITTIEGLSHHNKHPVQQAWLEEQVPQCGYCQSGQILTAVALLSRDKNPTDETINRRMNGLCRCGTYPRIKKAIRRAGKIMEKHNA